MSTKNERAWRRYLEARGISLSGDSYIIDASDLKEVTGREPRLMARFDTPEQLPPTLRNAGYAVLAVRNGQYLLVTANLFASVPKCNEHGEPVHFAPSFPFPLETLGRGAGESQYLDTAYAAGIFKDFLTLDPLYMTIRGRERTTFFSFELRGYGLVEVDAVQIEVDAGYESEREIVLIEAKTGSPGYLNIRQLYYPFCHFKALFPHKRVRSLFFTYDVRSDVYTLHEFVFDPPEHFNAIRHVRCKGYRLAARQLRGVDSLIDIRFETESDIVPQADDFNKIIDLLGAVDEGLDTSNAIADYFGFTTRQSSYYTEAAEYLGLLHRPSGRYVLSNSGARFLALDITERREHIAKAVVNSWLFRELISSARVRGFFGTEEIETLIRAVRRDGEARYTRTTIGRRRRTIEAWARWLADEYGCFEEDERTGRFYLR